MAESSASGVPDEPWNPNEGGEVIPQEPTITLTMQDGSIKVDRFLTLDAAEKLGFDLIQYVAAERGKLAVQNNNGGNPDGEG